MFQDGEFVKCGFDKNCKYCILQKCTNTIPIGCISLKESDRRIEVEKQYHKYGWCKNAGFWIVERHPEGGKRGSFESHRALNHYFNQQGFEKAIILEDDVKFLHNIPKYINKLPKDVSILYLGWYPSYCNNLQGYETIKKHFLQGPFLAIHAYLVTPVFMKWMEKLEYKDEILDKVICKKFSKTSYGLYPIIAVQKNGLDSTVSNFDIYKYIDKEQFMVSTSHMTYNTKYSLNIIIIIIIVLIILVIIVVVIVIKIIYSYN